MENEKTMTENLNEVAAFLKDCRVFFIATSEGNQPRVRPFGVAEIVNGKLYLTTGRKKDVYKQLPEVFTLEDVINAGNYDSKKKAQTCIHILIKKDQIKKISNKKGSEKWQKK